MRSPLRVALGLGRVPGPPIFDQPRAMDVLGADLFVASGTGGFASRA